MHRFDRDTAIRKLDENRFEATINTGWWIVAGPNGGYIAAIVLRAAAATVDDMTRSARSLTVHYMRPPAEGPILLTTKRERVGGRMTTVSIRMEQSGKLVALGLAAFSSSRSALEFLDHVPPDVPAPEGLDGLSRPDGRALPFHRRFDLRPCIGGPLFSLGDEAQTGGWIRPAEPRALDSNLLATLTDAWPPAVFTRLDPEATMGVPTVDLTIHFREPLPLAGAADDDFYLVRFHTRGARDGFIEEDGEVWSRDGLLLAQSRQLAVLV